METLENEIISLKISPKGAELKSAFHKKKKLELIYSGNSEFWNRSSPILFPIVGRLKNNQYTHNQKEYYLNQHGFARDFDFTLIEKNETCITFQLTQQIKSLEVFPYNFILQVSYELIKNKVIISYKVHNSNEQEMYFSIGAHPGFVCPIFENEELNDYFLEFEKNENFTRLLLDVKTGLINNKIELVESQDKCIQLSYDYFDKDAIIFENLNSSSITLKNKTNTYKLTFEFKKFPFLGIWTKRNAPFICLEPWYGLADNTETSGHLSEKKGIIRLNPSEIFSCAYSFLIEI